MVYIFYFTSILIEGMLILPTSHHALKFLFANAFQRNVWNIIIWHLAHGKIMVAKTHGKWSGWEGFLVGL